MKLLALALCLLLPLLAHAADSPLRDLWVYCPLNLAVDKNIDDFEALMKRASKAGYNGVMLADSKFARLSTMGKHYFENVERVKKIAAETKMQIVPALFSIGYSNDLLSNDPNLAEGLPVREALFVVKDGEARLVPEPAVSFKGADFADLKAWPLHDPSYSAKDRVAKMQDPKGANARLMQPLKLHPFRQYHVSVDVKTQDLEGSLPIISALTKKGGHQLIHSELGVKRTQDWKRCHAVFNSLNNEDVNLYFGSWGAKGGTLEWRDPQIEEVGLLNVLRRDGTPLVVKTEDGRLLKEGADFEKVADPRMGVVPYAGEYEIYHEAPAIKTNLPDGTPLRVSFYHMVTTVGGQVMICLSEPKTTELLREQAKRLHAAFGAKGYFMSHDEIRVLNWDQADADRHLDAGELLADNARTCVKILKEVNPGGDIYVWSDMFDPNHNAKKDYYLVNGDLAGSWKGLDPSVKIMLWYFGKRAESLKFFNDLGHPTMIAGYYDAAPEKVRQWLDAAKPYPNMSGVMYTTWVRNYQDLERFAKETLAGVGK